MTGNSKTYKGTFSNYPHFSGSKKKNLKLEKNVVKRVQAVVHAKVERLLGRPLSSPDIGDVGLPSNLAAAVSAVRTPEFEPPPLSQVHHHFTDEAEGDETMNLRIRSDGETSASHQYDDVHGEDHRTCDFEEGHK